MKILGNDFADVQTARLVLRRLRLDDAASTFTLLDNWNVIRFLSSPPWPYSREDAEAYVCGAVEHPPEFDEDVRAITLGDALIGVIGVRMRPANALQSGPGPNIGYWLGEPFWGRGFMTEAAVGFLQALFDSVDTAVVYSGAFADNGASLRVQEKIGFVREGPSSLFSKPRDAVFPHVNTALTRERFDAARGGAA